MKKLALAAILSIFLITGAVAAPAENTQLEEKTFMDKVFDAFSNLQFSLTSQDAGEFTAGESAHLKATFTIDNLDYTHNSITEVDVDKVYGGDVFLEVRSPSGERVYFEKVKDYSLNTYAKEGATYMWEADWKIPSDIGGESGDYEFKVYEGKNLYEDDQYVSGFNLCDTYGDFTYDGDCYDTISSEETNTYQISTGDSDNNPPSVNLEAVGSDFEAGDTVTLSSNAEDDNGIDRILWVIDDVQYSDLSGQKTVDYTFEEAGEHSVEVHVIDIHDEKTVNDMTVQVSSESNSRPSVSIEGVNGPYKTGETISMSMDAYDSDGYITSKEWSIDGRTSDSIKTSYQEAGEKTVTATVTDNEGATETAKVTFTVEASEEENKVWLSVADVEECKTADRDSVPDAVRVYDSESECMSGEGYTNSGGNESDGDQRWTPNNGECIPTTSDLGDTTFDTKENCQESMNDKIFGVDKGIVYIGGAVLGAIMLLVFAAGTIFIAIKV